MAEGNAELRRSIPSPITQLPAAATTHSAEKFAESTDARPYPEDEIETVQQETNSTSDADDHEDEYVQRPRTQSFWARDEAQRRKIPFAQRSLRITWGWFPVNMSTGAMASVLAQQPYTFNGLTTIGSIFYLIDLVTFCVFTLLIAGRFVRKPRAFVTSLHHPSESFFFGSYWVSIALLINGMHAYGVPHCGEWLIHTLRVIFWVYYGCALVVAVFQYQVIFHAERMSLSDAVPAWILPAYPFLVTGVMASTLAQTQEPTSSIQMLIAGIAGQGLGWILALFIYSVYLTRLISSQMPPPSMRPGMYISVGPAAYTCAGILSLGRQAKEKIPAHFLGITSFPVGDLWFGMSVPVALFLWLIAVWFSALSTLSVIRDARKMHFALQWWAFVFPNAGLAIATISIGEAVGSRGIKIAGAVITVLLVPLWFMCVTLHIRSVWRHDLLAPGKDMGVDDVNKTHDMKRLRAEEKKKIRRKSTRQGPRWRSPMCKPSSPFAGDDFGVEKRQQESMLAGP